MAASLSNPRHDGRVSEAEHEQRMKAARAVAEWELGSEGWAGLIIDAYMNPQEAMDRLAAEQQRCK
jgi:hypothetical protein